MPLVLVLADRAKNATRASPAAARLGNMQNCRLAGSLHPALVRSLLRLLTLPIVLACGCSAATSTEAEGAAARAPETESDAGTESTAEPDSPPRAVSPDAGASLPAVDASVPVDSELLIEPAAAVLNVKARDAHATRAFTARLMPSGTEVSVRWRVEGEIASVDQHGVVSTRGLVAGSTLLTANYGDLTAEAKISVHVDISDGASATDVPAGQRTALAQKLQFPGMTFLDTPVIDAIKSAQLPDTFDLVTALHACDTATDDAIRFALKKHARFIVLAPCCQAEVAAVLRKNKGAALANPLTEAWRHPLHTREFGSHITNVLRCLQLEAHGYQVNVTELVGWEHSLKNELIIASFKDLPRARATGRLHELLEKLGLIELKERFFVT